MEVVGLVSGGKDSCFNMMKAVEDGHRIVALANLAPAKPATELDSFMYQSVGSEGVELYSEAMGLPLYRRVISGSAVAQELDYQKTEGDEVEDLFILLQEVLTAHPNVKGVSVGAIFSTYQKKRVENVCSRLGLTPLCYLWEREQKELLTEMIDSGVEAILIKVAALGLEAKHLGKTLAEMKDLLFKLESKYGVHPCGEGGEYETFVVDCPLFVKRINIIENEIKVLSADDTVPVCFLHLKQLELQQK